MTDSQMRTRLRAALTQARKDRDAVLVSALRTVLGGLDNATAVPATMTAGAVETAAIGVGAADVSGRELAPEEEAAIVRAEIDELRERSTWDAAGSADAIRAAAALGALL